MSDFLTAVEVVLANEGGYSASPNDEGGATNHGISLRFLRSLPEKQLRRYGIFIEPQNLDPHHIESLTRDQAILIYRDEFWAKEPFEKIVNQRFCDYIFDCCVNHGVAMGIKLLQRAINDDGRSLMVVHEDGILGNNTLLELNRKIVDLFAGVLIAERANYMRLLVVLDPKKKEFLDGWINRCYRI